MKYNLCFHIFDTIKKDSIDSLYLRIIHIQNTCKILKKVKGIKKSEKMHD